MVDIHENIRSDGQLAAEYLAEDQTGGDIPEPVQMVQVWEVVCLKNLEGSQDFEDLCFARSCTGLELKGLVSVGVPKIVLGYCFAEGQTARQSALS